MHKKTLVKFLIILCLSLIPNLLFAQQNPTSSNGDNKFTDYASMGTPIPLLNALTIYGEKHNCFFTIEEVVSEDTETMNSISSSSLREPVYKQNSPKTFSEMLDRLGQMLPNAYIKTNASNPNIIHIIDNRLKTQEGYSISEVIPIIDFEGTLPALIQAINKQKPNVLAPPFTLTHEYNDGTTIVHTKGNNLTVRETLSNFIELPRRNKVLWIAKTNLGKDKKTYVRFIF